MAKKQIKDTTGWRNSTDGIAKYKAAKTDAQARADSSGRDFGLEANDLFKSWNVFGLPNRENRCGHELRCEVVSCSSIEKTAKGHGYR
jgi:hypothetical protein